MLARIFKRASGAHTTALCFCFLSTLGCGVVGFRPTLCAAATEAPPLQPLLDFAATRLQQEIEDFPPGSGTFPGRNTTQDGSWAVVSLPDWVSGFGVGCLWKLHALTGDRAWLEAATAKLPDIEPMKTSSDTHDIGFIMLSSFGNALDAKPAPKLSTAKRYSKVLLTAAASLAKRYNTRLGLIRSWGKDLLDTEFKVIIDNMMNLELLFRAASMPGGRARWRAMAASHARRTARDFVRADGSTMHKVIYDLGTGTLAFKGTHQGYSDNTTWTRGQAWAVYGFTLAYEATKEPLFRSTAERVANYFLKRLSADSVPLWDFDAPAGMPYKDTSAGAIAAAGMLRLSRVASRPALAAKYRRSALRMIQALAGEYLAVDTQPALASILKNGTVAAMKGQHSTGTIFGDYYFLEALSLAYRRQQG